MLIRKFCAFVALTILSGCLPEAPVAPIKIAMHALPENEALIIAEQLNYFPARDVHIVEAPLGLDFMPALKSGAVDAAVTSLSSVLDWSSQGLDLTIVAVINSTNDYSFPARPTVAGGRLLDSEVYNVIAVRSDVLAHNPLRIEQLVDGWRHVQRDIERGKGFEDLSAHFVVPDGDHNFISYNANKALLLVDSAVSLHAVIRSRVTQEVTIPEIDGRFFDEFASDAEKAQ